MMNCKGFERKLLLPNAGTIPTVVWKGLKSPPKEPIKMDDVPVEIRTENLPDTSLERYSQTNPHSQYFEEEMKLKPRTHCLFICVLFNLGKYFQSEYSSICLESLRKPT
jgi:hypothetical protein